MAKDPTTSEDRVFKEHPKELSPRRGSTRPHGSRPAGRPGSGAETLDLSVARRTQKNQNLGRQLVSTLYMLIRNVKIYSPDNAIFLKPIETFRELINRLIASEGELQLQAIDTSVYINEERIRFEFSTLESVQYLTNEFEKRNIGGLTAVRALTSHEIKDFLVLFCGEDPDVYQEEQRDFAAFRLSSYAEIKRIVDKLEAGPSHDRKVDRKRYLLTVYARSVFFMQTYFERMKSGKKPLPFAQAARLVQDFVDLCYSENVHFLGVTTCRSNTEYLPYHSVNTSLLAIVFGQELGLDKSQLHELGMIALFSHVGLIDVPDAVMNSPAPLTSLDRDIIDRHPLRAVHHLLSSRGLDRTSMRRMIGTYESRIDVSIQGQSAGEETRLVLPKMKIGVFGRIIAICDAYDALTSKRPFRDAYGPEIALALMAHELRYRFDPHLLRIFMKVMAIQPIHVVDDTSTRSISWLHSTLS